MTQNTNISDTDLMKLALDDIRARQKAQMDSILHQDKDAQEIMKLYVTLSLAIASAGIGAFTSGRPNLLIISYSLFASLPPLVAGIVLCVRATTMIYIPLVGRDANFWEVIFDNRHDFDNARKSYFLSASEELSKGRNTASKITRSVTAAKMLGIAAVGFMIFVIISFSDRLS